MAITIEFDKINSSISNDSKGYKLNRSAHIKGLTGNADAILYSALSSVLVPVIGTPHPIITEITLQSVSGSVIDTETVLLALTYYKDRSTLTGQANAKVTITASTATEEITTSLDLPPIPFSATFEGRPNSGQSGISTGVVWSNVTVDRPRLNIDFEYISLTIPKTEINAYLGSINLSSWNGYAKKTMLCTAINVSEVGDKYSIKYSFAYNEDTWDFVGQVIGLELPLDPHSLNPDATLDLITGQKTFKVYNEVDFNALGFII